MFALADPAAEAVPGAQAGDPGGVGALGADEQHVGGAVGVEPGRDGEHPAPGVAGGELGDGVDELGVQGREPLGPGGCSPGHRGTAAGDGSDPATDAATDPAAAAADGSMIRPATGVPPGWGRPSGPGAATGGWAW